MKYQEYSLILIFCTKDEFLFEDTLFFNFWTNNDLEKADVFKPIQEFIAKKIFWLLWNVNLSLLFLLFNILPDPLRQSQIGSNSTYRYGSPLYRILRARGIKWNMSWGAEKTPEVQKMTENGGDHV